VPSVGKYATIRHQRGAVRNLKLYASGVIGEMEPDLPMTGAQCGLLYENGTGPAVRIQSGLRPPSGVCDLNKTEAGLGARMRSPCPCAQFR
jgi:hypothetical protein